MLLPERRRREARLIDLNMKNAFRSLSKYKKFDKECEYIFSNISHPIFNGVLETNPNTKEIESLIEKVSSDYQAKSIQHCWWTCENTPSHLPSILIKKGYNKGPSFSGMHARVDTISIKNESDPNIIIKKIVDLKNIEEWVKPIQVSFDFSDEVTTQFVNCYKELLNDQRLVHFSAYYKGELAGSSTIFFDNDSAGLYNGGVFPKFRRLGVITHLAKEMILEVKKRGYMDIVVQAAEITRHLGLKMGFKEYINYEAYFFNF